MSKIAMGIVYPCPTEEGDSGVYKAAAEQALSVAIGREVIKAIPPTHEISKGEPRLPSHLSLPGMDRIVSLTCYVFSEEDLKEVFKSVGFSSEDITAIMGRLTQEG